MNFNDNPEIGQPVLEVSREEAINYIASALHNFTVLSAAQLAELFGLELAGITAMQSAVKDQAALLALGVTRAELEAVEITHAH